MSGSLWSVVSRDFEAALARPRASTQSPLGRLVLIAQTELAVRSLPGFDRRFHRIPTRVTPSAVSFVAAIGAASRRDQLHMMRARVREHFGYRRRQLKSGEDHLSTPDFDYCLEHRLNSEDPSTVFLRAEVSEFRGLQLLSAPAFVAAMCGPGPGAHRFDRIRIEHRVPCEIEVCIDELEDAGLRVDYPEDCAYMMLQQASATLRVDPCAVELQTAPGEQPGALLEQLLEAITQLALRGVDVVPRASR